MRKIFINSEYITLGQFLKFTSLISSGGEVKYFLDNNKVFVNETPENRRGKKLFPGDLVKINNQIFEINTTNGN